MRGMKIPPQDFALKMQGGGGGLCARGGGRICGTLRYYPEGCGYFLQSSYFILSKDSTAVPIIYHTKSGTIYHTKCGTIYHTKCETIYHTKCETIYHTKC